MAANWNVVLRQSAREALDKVLRGRRLLPGTVIASARAVAVHADRLRPKPVLEDWSRPIITGGDRLADSPSPHAEQAAPPPSAYEVVAPTRSSHARSASTDAPGIRCLLVTSALDVGGMDEVVAFLARRLPDHGLVTAVLHAPVEPVAECAPLGRLARMLQAQGITVMRADEAAGRRWIGEWQPDVVSAHGAPGWVLTAAEEIGISYVDNLHGMHTLFNADWVEESKRGTKLAAVIAVSELIRQQYLAGNAQFLPERVVTIPNGVDEERREAEDRDASRAEWGVTSEFLFVSLARHCLQKNTYGLVSAFDEVAAEFPDAHLVIAGSAPDPRYLRRVLQLRDTLRYRDRVHIRDHVAAPAKLLAAADSFVLDSFFEGWSLASMEALHAGIPVVLSDVGGAREQVGDMPERGFVVRNPLGDPLRVDWASVGAARFQRQVNRNELVAALRRMVIDRETYLRGRQRLADESAGRFSADACLGRHAEVLKTVVAGRRLPVFDLG